MSSELNNIFVFFVLFVVLFLTMLAYFRIAEKFRIIDKPNQRSSHTVPTVRGGGIIFMVAALLWFVVNGLLYPWFFSGLILIAVVSFIDDIKAISPALRFPAHLISFLLMGWEAGLLDQPWWAMLVVLVVGIGAINAFNFMDGINGITGLYAFANLLTMLYVNSNIFAFTYHSFIFYVLISVIIFLTFNFRKKARCFAGDVGSVSLAFIQIFLLLVLILKTGYYGWILLMAVYGIDSVITIIYRLRNKENIFEPHRSHLYQYFSNELGVSHLFVSMAYAIVQVVINIVLINFWVNEALWLPVTLLIAMGLVYVAIREVVLKRIGKQGLFMKTN